MFEQAQNSPSPASTKLPRLLVNPNSAIRLENGMPAAHKYFRNPPARSFLNAVPDPARLLADPPLSAGQLGMLSIRPLQRKFRLWRLRALERHYLICADYEQQQARQAHLNASWYQKQAALARSAAAEPVLR
jgi:hypothetical protein